MHTFSFFNVQLFDTNIFFLTPFLQFNQCQKNFPYEKKQKLMSACLLNISSDLFYQTLVSFSFCFSVSMNFYEKWFLRGGSNDVNFLFAIFKKMGWNGNWMIYAVEFVNWLIWIVMHYILMEFLRNIELKIKKVRLNKKKIIQDKVFLHFNLV